ncbi:efflux RND transporter periplasmic adaptor subunit [Caldimonas sp. KR1-144]|uniref:efflux RND transporter periplasmic adaptor subunit n=1 Tax=Caldimonas sp. KR1-144 TaxID=3400911 RepID=UPI003C0B6DF3
MPPLRITAVTLAALAAAAVIVGCSRSGAAGGAPAGPAAPQVGVVTLAAQTVPVTTELPGRTSPYLIAEVRPQVTGIVLERRFAEGGEVKPGQPLYRIDPATYEATLASARAAQAKAEANLASTRAKAQRYAELVAIKAVSQQDNDDAQAALKQAEAELQSAKAAVETARIDVGYTSVASPIGGRIGKSSVTQGALVTANQATALATVQQLDPIYVDVTQTSADLLRLRKELGQDARKQSAGVKVTLKLEDGSVYPLPGKLQFSDVTVDPSTGSVTLRALFPNPDRVLLPGMYVKAQIAEGVREQAILAPQQGVTRNAKGEATALVVGANNQLEQRQLVAERTVGDRWLVTSGLAAGDKLVVDGLQKVRPGATVTPVEATPSVVAAAASAAAPTAAK